MGGGGVMRAAAKVAGIGVVSHGRRAGINVVQPAEQSVVRCAKRPVSPIAASQAGISVDVQPVQQVSSEIMDDDWDFLEEELMVGGGEPIGRLIFGGVPTLEEAKEATNDLKDALESFLSSPRASSCYAANQVSGLQLLSSAEHLETKSCVRFDSKPKDAFQAFTLLSENPAAQSVVASIATDPNVRNAVLQNDALTEFLQSQEDDVDYEYQGFPRSPESPRMSEHFLDGSDEISTSDLMQKIKTTVAEMVNSVSDYIQEIFGFSAAENENENEGAVSIFNIDKCTCFVSLAVMAIAVVLLKR
ncbi:hypothetical protein SLE2022_395140 [Rubroshorea leprosula]